MQELDQARWNRLVMRILSDTLMGAMRLNRDSLVSKIKSTEVIVIKAPTCRPGKLVFTEGGEGIYATTIPYRIV